MRQAIASATNAGLEYIARVQQADGGFASFSSRQPVPLRADATYRTTFVPSLILGMLAQVPGPAAHGIRGRLAAWLLDQKSAHWSFNYWAAGTDERRAMPYPDDLDDTFCALAGLYQHNPALVDAAALASVAKLLIATESRVGGPYHTWLVAHNAPAAWQDIDLAVNAQIGHFLLLAAEPLPNVTRMFEEAIAAGRFESPYYPSAYPVAYYVARAYRGPLQARLARWLLDRRDAARRWQTPLHTALAVSALLRCGTAPATLRPAVRYLLDSQRPDGSWPAEAFCLDPARDGVPYYHGAPALTTACVLEALQAYLAAAGRRAGTRRESRRSVPVAASGARDPHRQIIRTARAQFARLSPPLARQAMAMLERLQAGDPKHEITLLPHRFAASLAPAHPLPAGLTARLGLATLYGWMAYTIYDDFLDGEGVAKQLPVANIAMRYSLDAFRQAVPGHDAFQKQVGQCFDLIDQADAWEVSECRFAVADGRLRVAALPRYGRRSRLAERSIGHALGPLGVLAASGQPAWQQAAPALQAALAQYLIARQLCDDMHDWQQDLQAGHISYVVGKILRGLRLRPGEHPMARLLPRARRQFWHHAIVDVCQTAGGHTAQARRIMDASQPLAGNPLLRSLLDGIDGTLRTTLDEQAEAVRFLRAYRDGGQAARRQSSAGQSSPAI